jgi:hypothetical protein
MGRLAEDWAGEQPRGWPQIAAVLEHLRADFTLDAQASAPADHPAPVLWFLNESRRGPDYLFATSAALMLRSLGYSTRVALGYYASPSAYDFETGHTPVRATDVHVWPEVILRDNQWLVIEPTPGYAVLPPLQPWREWLLERLVALGSWMRERAVSLSIMAIAVAWLIHWRLIVLDAIRTLAWQLAPGRTWRLRILRTLRLIEARAGWVGRARPASETVTSWAERLAGPDRSLPELARLSDWAAYAPDGPAPWSRDEIKCICRRAVHHWNLQRWQAAGNKEMG